MRLWSYQHPSVVETLQRGERYVCRWEWVPGERWQNAFRWMGEQMAQRDIHTGEYAPVWTWHSVRRIGGKPDLDCADALLFGYQLAQGIDVLELAVPDHLALPSCYGAWNNVLDSFTMGYETEVQDIADCFAVRLTPRRGRPPIRFPGIQACLPYIEPAWLVSWEKLDIELLYEQRRAAGEASKAFFEQYEVVEWKFGAKGKLSVKITKK